LQLSLSLEQCNLIQKRPAIENPIQQSRSARHMVFQDNICLFMKYYM
jgi:hypothetical protein